MSKKQIERKPGPFYDQVMRLGDMYRYRPLQVNNSLLIGAGPAGWSALAWVLTSQKRVDEIASAIEKEGVYDFAVLQAQRGE